MVDITSERQAKGIWSTEAINEGIGGSCFEWEQRTRVLAGVGG